MSKLGIAIFSACVLVGLVPAAALARSPDLYAAQHGTLAPPSAAAARAPEGEVFVGPVAFNPAPAPKPAPRHVAAPAKAPRKDCMWYPMWSSEDEHVFVCGM